MVRYSLTLAVLLAACGAELEMAGPSAPLAKGDAAHRVSALYGRVGQARYGGAALAINPRTVRLHAVDAGGARAGLVATRTLTRFGMFYFDALPAAERTFELVVLVEPDGGELVEPVELHARQLTVAAATTTFVLVDEVGFVDSAPYRFLGLRTNAPLAGHQLVAQGPDGSVDYAHFDETGWAWVVSDSLAEGRYLLRLSRFEGGETWTAPFIECTTTETWPVDLAGPAAMVAVERPDPDRFDRCTCRVNCTAR